MGNSKTNLSQTTQVRFATRLILTLMTITEDVRIDHIVRKSFDQLLQKKRWFYYIPYKRCDRDRV